MPFFISPSFYFNQFSGNFPKRVKQAYSSAETSFIISFGYPQQLKPSCIALERLSGEMSCTLAGKGSSDSNNQQDIPL
ncbi:hypothetical protein HMPREF9393_0639 [Streptococcus sanguinis SK1056]|uniref:Uncharacterized protein n=1 Tax=Streptococcus sanguinis SK1056 TaxID=888820 RepID=F3UAZ6_STRSA|nr:hypothetical protein HMPREF9393_0639 [Streptococcus sanguinis SK1056]